MQQIGLVGLYQALQALGQPAGLMQEAMPPAERRAGGDAAALGLAPHGLAGGQRLAEAQLGRLAVQPGQGRAGEGVEGAPAGLAAVAAQAASTTARHGAGGLAAGTAPLLVGPQFDGGQRGGSLLAFLEHRPGLCTPAFGQTVDLSQPSLEFVVSHGPASAFSSSTNSVDILITAPVFSDCRELPFYVQWIRLRQTTVGAYSACEGASIRTDSGPNCGCQRST